MDAALGPRGGGCCHGHPAAVGRTCSEQLSHPPGAGLATVGPRGHPASRGCPGWSRGPSGTACGGGDLSMLLDKGLGIHQMATVDASANSIFFFFFFWSFHKTFKSNKACSLFYEPASAALFFQPFPGCRAGVPCEVDGGIGCLPVVGRLPGDHVPSSQPPLPRLGQQTAGTDGHPGSFPTSPPAPGLCARTLRSPGHEQSPLPRGLDHVLLLSTKNSPVPSRSAQG